MSETPTLEQLRARVHKDRHREIGNWLACRVARPTAVYGTWLAVRLGVSANLVTLVALLANLAAAAALATGGRIGLLAAAALLHLAFWLDHVDGQVARWRGTAGVTGVYLDYLMHHASAMTLGFALGVGLAVHDAAPVWSLAGFAIALGLTMLNLHNDCRYKAFFQRLKAAQSRFQVQGGSGGRPTPPIGWPRYGWGILTWPLAKSCEPHVVLVAISVLAVVALLPGGAWIGAWRAYSGWLALVAPGLAVSRIARTVWRDVPAAEFQRWFQPLDDA
jgi:phosphatidylglycerophosphate synthase